MQVINFDTEHFKNTVIGNVGESTFQEGEIREIIKIQIMNRIRENKREKVRGQQDKGEERRGEENGR